MLTFPVYAEKNWHERLEVPLKQREHIHDGQVREYYKRRVGFHFPADVEADQVGERSNTNKTNLVGTNDLYERRHAFSRKALLRHLSQLFT